MKWLLALLLLPFFAGATLAPEYIATRIAKAGEKLSDTSLEWKKMLAGISQGKNEWLRLIPDISATLDNEKAVQLEGALAMSLQPNPRGTLQVLKKLDSSLYPFMTGSEMVCRLPLEKPEQEITTFYRKTREALLTTSDGALCLWLLESSFEDWQQQIN